MLAYIFYKQLGWPVGDEGYLLATANATTVTRADRERLAQMLFETFNLRGLYLLDSCTACVYTAGKTTGVAVDIGHTGTTLGQVRLQPLGLCCLGTSAACHHALNEPGAMQ